jgi:hypothetical protein
MMNEPLLLSCREYRLLARLLGLICAITLAVMIFPAPLPGKGRQFLTDGWRRLSRLD